MRRTAISAAILITLPISIVAIASIANYVAELTSPCVVWGGGNFHKAADVKTTCKQYSGDSRTRSQAVLWMAGVPGVILMAAVLGVWGAVTSKKIILVVAGLLMLPEVVLLVFSFWPLALLAGVGLLVVAYRLPAQADSGKRP